MQFMKRKFVTQTQTHALIHIHRELKLINQLTPLRVHFTFIHNLLHCYRFIVCVCVLCLTTLPVYGIKQFVLLNVNYPNANARSSTQRERK